MVKQLIPSGYCLKCLGCCRFKEENSVWLPCLLDEEIQDMLDKDLSSVVISKERKIQPVSDGKGGFVCTFLEENKNKCKIYNFRPFECQLYPFLINLRDKKALLTVDLNCPYVRENVKTKEFKAYAEELGDFLNSPAQLELLKNNPQLLQVYEDVMEIIELNL